MHLTRVLEVHYSVFMLTIEIQVIATETITLVTRKYNPHNIKNTREKKRVAGLHRYQIHSKHAGTP
jgi:hypothetical protein